jgi:hypothetical protein
MMLSAALQSGIDSLPRDDGGRKPARWRYPGRRYRVASKGGQKELDDKVGCLTEGGILLLIRTPPHQAGGRSDKIVTKLAKNRFTAATVTANNPILIRADATAT